jgi:hypothetical protein
MPSVGNQKASDAIIADSADSLADSVVLEDERFRQRFSGISNCCKRWRISSRPGTGQAVLGLQEQ